MAIPQPIATDQLNAPDHSLLHRQIATDPAGAVKSVTIDSAGRVCNTFIVEPNSPSIDTISKAMALAAAGDTILVAPGTYTEAVTFSQDNLTLKALGSAENTIITQAAAVVVNFGAMSGCTLSGFTVSVTAADGSADHCISSANDATTDYNIIENCIITHATSAALGAYYVIRSTDGNHIFRNNRITVTNTYANTSSGYCNGVIFLGGASSTQHIYNNIITLTTSSTATNSGDSIIQADANITNYIFNNVLTLTSAAKTTSHPKVLRVDNAGDVNYIMGNTITLTCSSTALCTALTVGTSTSYIVGNFVNATTGDGDGAWFNGGAGTAYATGNVIIGDCAYTASGTPYVGGNLIKTKAAYNGGDDTTYTNFKLGVCVGADALNNILDDGSHGSGSGALYLGNATIDTVFTGQHYYQLGDTDLEVGECVRLSKDKKIYRTKVAKDESAIGIYWGLPNTEDAFLNEKTSYAVAVIGDSREIHDTYPLTGAWVTTDAGIVKNGDYLCSSTRDGWLEKQTDDVMHSYTVAQARQDINTDTKIAYVYLVQ